MCDNASAGGVANAGYLGRSGADLLDSQTNTLLAHVSDREQGRELAGQFQIANRVTNTAEARRAIGGWARALRNALDRARQP
jgi:hypothetical protein